MNVRLARASAHTVHVPDGLRQRRRRPPRGVDAELAFGLEDDHVVVLGERPRR